MPGGGANPCILRGKSPLRLSFSYYTYMQKRDCVHMYVSTYVNNMYAYAYLQNWNHNAYSFVFYFSLTLLWLFSMAFNLRNTIFKKRSVHHSTLFNHFLLEEYLGWSSFAIMNETDMNVHACVHVRLSVCVFVQLSLLFLCWLKSRLEDPFLSWFKVISMSFNLEHIDAYRNKWVFPLLVNTLKGPRDLLL